MPLPNSSANPPLRRGTAYVLALGLAMLITAVSVGTLLAVRARFAGARDAVDLTQAQRLAESGIEWGVRSLNQVSTYAGGTVPATSITQLDFTAGSVRVGISQDAADADATTLTPATISVGATVGVAARRYRVKAFPIVAAIEAFEYPLAIGGTLTLASGSKVAVPSSADGLVGSVVRSGVGTISGTLRSTALGSADEDVAMQRSLDRPAFPTTDDVNLLRASATTLTVSGSGAISFNRVLLSPMANPYGQLNQRGIYVLDCAGRAISITESRIVGTLILLNPGAESKVISPVLLEPAVRGHPALIVVGDLAIEGAVGRIDESGKNFNPQGSPRPFFGGSADEDTSDRFNATFDGPIVVLGNASVSGTANLTGLVVTGNCGLDGTIEATRDDWSSWAPPPEWRGGRWRVDRTTLTEIDTGP